MQSEMKVKGAGEDMIWINGKKISRKKENINWEENPKWGNCRFCVRQTRFLTFSRVQLLPLTYHPMNVLTNGECVGFTPLGFGWDCRASLYLLGRHNTISLLVRFSKNSCRETELRWVAVWPNWSRPGSRFSANFFRPPGMPLIFFIIMGVILLLFLLLFLLYLVLIFLHHIPFFSFDFHIFVVFHLQ